MSVRGYDFSLDSHGVPHARAEDPDRALLASYLAQEVQLSFETIDALLEELARVDAGESEAWSTSGQAHALTIDALGVAITTLWGDPVTEQFVPADEFRRVLLAWRDFVRKARAN